jgi:predicted  nucleic acid-binding Zn-ribbon protein
MESQDINYLINKYSKTPNNRSQDLQSSYSPRSSFSPLRDHNSKAYAAAMRALQERIRFLESENNELFQNYKGTEARLQESQRLNDKLEQQIEDLAAKDRSAQQMMIDLKQELAKTQREAQSLQAQIRRLETKDLEGLLQENLTLKREIDNTMRELADGKARDLTTSLALQKLQDEKLMLQDELKNEKWRSQEIEGEHERVRRNLIEARRTEQEASDLRLQNKDLMKTLQDLESKCRNLEEQSFGRTDPTSLNSRASRTSRKDLSPKKSVSFRKSRSKSRASKSTSPSSPRLSRPQNRHIGAHLVEYGDFGERVLRMESEMNELQNKYRRLVSASKSETNGLERLKQNIGQLAGELQDKGSILKKLKSEQISGMSFSREL